MAKWTDYEYESDHDGISHEEWKRFKSSLPMEYQLILDKLVSWHELTGDDGILWLNDFIDLMDKLLTVDVKADELIEFK